MPTFLEILLKSMEEHIIFLGFEPTEAGYLQMRKLALEYKKLEREGKIPPERLRDAYVLYRTMSSLEANEDFLKGRYPEEY